MPLAPEILIEQVMGYAVGATEMIPTLKPVSQPYTIAILPQGPHFYTGLLQAAGYLLLDSQKKKLLVISQQTDDMKDILIDTNSYGPVFGKSRKNSLTSIAVLGHQLDAKFARPEQESLFEQIHFQLPFLSVITDTEEILHISIGEHISKSKIKKIINRIIHHGDEYNIILLTNIVLPGNPEKSKEHKMIADIMEKSSQPLLQIFRQVADSYEIIAYVNPGDFGVQGVHTIRYICAVG